MPRKLPSTPIEVFRPTPETMAAIPKVKLFGWWDYPLDGAATDSKLTGRTGTTIALPGCENV